MGAHLFEVNGQLIHISQRDVGRFPLNNTKHVGGNATPKADLPKVKMLQRSCIRIYGEMVRLRGAITFVTVVVGFYGFDALGRARFIKRQYTDYDTVSADLPQEIREDALYDPGERQLLQAVMQ